MLEMIAFLGNPGGEYRKNRHNAGRLLCESLDYYGELRWQRKFKGLYAQRGGIHYLEPETYMNRSGDSVQQAASFYQVDAGRILVVHDELELPLGTISLKYSGGLGGHNGLRSLKASLGTADFWRLRIGIGRPNHDDVASYVLENFYPAEEEMLQASLEEAGRLLALALEGEVEKLLPQWAKKKVDAP